MMTLGRSKSDYGCARPPFWTDFLRPRLNFCGRVADPASPPTRLDVVRSLSQATPSGSGEAGRVVVVICRDLHEDEQNGTLKVVAQGALEARRVSAIVIIS